MLIDFNKLKNVKISNLNNGDGAVDAWMYMDNENKIMISRIPAGASIGVHQHITSSEINYVISGGGKAVCDGKEEVLSPGTCHYCHKGSCHSIINDGNSDLVLFTAVAEQ